MGGLKNALERGESLAKAKQSFINAGYKSEEIEAVIQKMPTTVSPVSNSAPVPAEKAPAQEPAKTPAPIASTTTQPATATAQPLQKHISKTLIIILIVVSILIIAGATILGLFWDKWF